MDRGFKIVDVDGKRATQGSYLTEHTAWVDIADWIRRWERGGRPDLDIEWLEGLDVLPEDGSLD